MGEEDSMCELNTYSSSRTAPATIDGAFHVLWDVSPYTLQSTRPPYSFLAADRGISETEWNNAIHTCETALVSTSEHNFNIEHGYDCVLSLFLCTSIIGSGYLVYLINKAEKKYLHEIQSQCDKLNNTFNDNGVNFSVLTHDQYGYDELCIKIDFL